MSHAQAAHIRGFDGLRAVAVLLVIAFHAWRDARSLGPLRPWWGLLDVGYLGVDLFFALSGFLITGILLRERGKPGWWWRFFTRRALRIWPLYFFVLSITVLPRMVLLGEWPKIPLWSLLLFVSNWLVPYEPQTEQMYAVTWSLSVEEQFYLAWPLIVALSSARALKVVIAALLVLSPLCRWWVHDPSDQAALMLTPCRADILAAGAWWAVWAHEGRVMPRGGGLLIGATVAALIAGGCSGTFVVSSLWFSTIGFSLVAAAFAFIVALVAGGEPPAAIAWLLERPALVHIGRVSFGMYMLHSIFVYPLAVSLHKLGLPTDIELALLIALAIAVTTAAATLVFRTIEQPFLALKDRWT